MRPRTVALVVAAAVAVVAAVVITVTGRTHASPERTAVTRYIKNVDTLQQQLRVSLTGAGIAYRDLSIGRPLSAAQRRQLVASEATLREIHKRLVELPAPAPARRLKALLVELAQRQVSVAREVHQVALFVPRYVSLLRKVRDAATQLGRALAAVPAVKALHARGTKAQIAAARAAHLAEVARASSRQADAIDVYVVSMQAIRDRSNAVKAPSVLGPVYRAETKAIADSVVAGAALAGALRSKSRARVSLLSRGFAEATRSAGAVAVQRAEIAAIEAYNGRVRAIGKVQDKIRLEVGRLGSATG